MAAKGSGEGCRAEERRAAGRLLLRARPSCDWGASPAPAWTSCCLTTRTSCVSGICRPGARTAQRHSRCAKWAEGSKRISPTPLAPTRPGWTAVTPPSWPTPLSASFTRPTICSTSRSPPWSASLSPRADTVSGWPRQVTQNGKSSNDLGFPLNLIRPTAPTGQSGRPPPAPVAERPWLCGQGARAPARGEQFWGCTAYPECKGTLPAVAQDQRQTPGGSSDPADQTDQTDRSDRADHGRKR